MSAWLEFKCGYSDSRGQACLLALLPPSGGGQAAEGGHTRSVGVQSLVLFFLLLFLPSPPPLVIINIFHWAREGPALEAKGRGKAHGN